VLVVLVWVFDTGSVHEEHRIALPAKRERSVPRLDQIELEDSENLHDIQEDDCQ
jgi:hypothetical protein